MNRREKLTKSISNLLKLKGKCYMHVIDGLEMSEMSIKQINYLKKFKSSECITTSSLAESLDLSKPTITELVKKFIKMGCVYKLSCPEDGRVHYLKLTDKGLKIANVEQLTTDYLAKQLENKLSDEDIETLIKIFDKIE